MALDEPVPLVEEWEDVVPQRQRLLLDRALLRLRARQHQRVSRTDKIVNLFGEATYPDMSITS